MPPVEIVRDIRKLIQNKLLPRVPNRWSHQYGFGLQAYGLRPFSSAASNARQVVAHPDTASTKTDRLLANSGLAGQFGHIFDGLGLVRPSSYVNIDHSDMNGLVALVGAIQTKKGRAIPCLVEATHSDKLSARDDAPSRKQALRRAWAQQRCWQSFTGHTIDTLQSFRDRLGFWPKLVFDRGFGNESIVRNLQAEGAVFYIRLKAGRYVELAGQRTEVKALPDKDTLIQLFGLSLRVVRSPKSRRVREPWYILTNDFSSSRNKIVRIYYHRFEIEETFRDLKHVFELRRTRLNRPNSLKAILWLVSFGIALLYLVSVIVRQLPKKQRSWIRQGFEQLQQAFALLLWSG